MIVGIDRKKKLHEGAVSRLEESLEDHRYLELLLVVSLVISTFGSALVLMPEEGAVGEFHEPFDVEKPVFYTPTTETLDVEDGNLQLFVDIRVRNPNDLTAEIESVNYRTYMGSENLEVESVRGSTSIPPGSEKIVTLKADTEAAELVSEDRSFSEGLEKLRVEGVMTVSVSAARFKNHFIAAPY